MKLCVALDMQTKEDNLALAKEIKHCFRNEDIWLKVGLRSFVRDGKEFVRELQNLGFKIFLDLKIYDIPNTMLDCLKECHNIGVDMLTIHASCGIEAMESLSNYILSQSSNMLIVAVSVLTSFDSDHFMRIYNTDIKSGVSNFAQMVYKSGINGLVCSIDEIEIIKTISNSLIAVIPGIRLEMNSDDQKRVANPKEARQKGSDFIVVGRPIYNANNKQEIIYKILNDIK